jgi:hypothetical protein
MTEYRQHALRENLTSTTVHVPIVFCRRGGRKQVVTPSGAPAWAPRITDVDSTLVKALARAFRWRRMLESGEFGSVSDLAAAEKINASYLARVLRLTLLAPDIVEQIMSGRQPHGLGTETLLRPFAVQWDAQRRRLAATDDPSPPSAARY